eukprot:1628531-Prymnesium_polylepis.1
MSHSPRAAAPERSSSRSRLSQVLSPRETRGARVSLRSEAQTLWVDSRRRLARAPGRAGAACFVAPTEADAHTPPRALCRSVLPLAPPPTSRRNR